jgi:GT2 family glycosyltransferase
MKQGGIMKASVLIPTFWTDDDGPERLANLKQVVGGLYKQTEPDFELVTLVDGPPDNPTLRYLEGVKRRAKFPMHVLSRPKEGVRIASAHNALVQAALAPIVIGIQDNVLPGPGFVKAHVEIHEARPDLQRFVIGLACRDPQDLTTDHRYERGFAMDKPWFDAWARNFSATRQAILDVGGYDEAFDGAWGHEDVELAYRLFKAGVDFVCTTEANSVGTYLVNKQIPRTQDSLRRQASIFYRKHGFWI